MKSLKKTLVLLVVFSMILSTLVPAFAATDVDGLECEDQVTRMEALGIIKGFEDGSFRPTETITRAQMAVIICKMTGVTDAIAEANRYVASKFSDVAAGEWYTGYVNIASNNGIITGFPDGTFRPNETLTLNQVLTLCVKALGRGGYVDKMGTWPANYIAEAARLNLLKDVKGASDANRGNVAVICWNTLNSKTWYVTGENLDGEVSLGSDGESQTLLEINFVDFTDKEGNLKEIENVKVLKTPSMTKGLADRQVAFDISDWKLGDSNPFDFEIGAPRRNEETSTYIEKDDSSELNGKLIAYVPEDVWDDLDSLYGKELTIVFGEDNVVALIAVTNDEVIDNEFFTKYVASDKELTIGGTKYKLAGEANKTKTTVNNVSEDGGLEEALKTILNVETLSNKKFDKNIKANVILNSKGKVTEVNLYVSGDFSDYYTQEFIVGKIKNEKIQDHKSTTIYDWKDVEDEDLPKVTINDKKASVDEIEVGDVLTVYYKDKDCESDEIVKILVSRNTVEGEITDINNKNKLTIDGEEYKMSKANALLVVDEIKDSTTTEGLDFTAYYEENVTIYLNVYGEYVAMMADEEVADYQFGIVDYYFKAELDENGVYTQQLKILLDGRKNTSYKLVYDSEADDKKIDALADNVKGAMDRENSLLKALTTAMTDEENGDKDKTVLVAFKADANNEIELDDMTIIPYNAKDGIVDGKYEAYQVTTSNKADYDNKRITINDKRYNATDADIAKSKDGKDEPEKITWKKLVDQSKDTLAADALVICEKGKYDIVYIVTTGDPDGGSDATYAVVNGLDGTKTLNNKKYFDVATLLTENNETIYLSWNREKGSKAVENAIISYQESSDRITASKTLVDVDEINRLDLDKEIKGIYENELVGRKHIEAEAKCDCKGVVTPETTDKCTVKTREHVVAEAKCDCGEVEAPETTNKCTVKTREHVPANEGSSQCDCKEVEAPSTTDKCTVKTREHVVAEAKCDCKEVEAPETTDKCTVKTREHVAAEAKCDCGEVKTPSTTAKCTPTMIKAALRVVKVDNEYLVYTDDEVINLPDIKVNTDDVVVFNATGDKVVVSDFSEIEDGDLVIPFLDDKGEAILLVIIAE